jgi:hypothetical protein
MIKFQFKIIFNIFQLPVIFMLVPFYLRNKYSLFCRLDGLGTYVNIPYLYVGFPSEKFHV